jgi:hypothetical protein
MRSARRRGGILPLVAVLMVAVALCAGLVLDMSRAYAQKNEMQTAADAAALSGVIELLIDTTAVEGAARHYSSINPVLHRSIPDGNTDIECGVWTDETQTFESSPRCGAGENAVTFTIRDTASFTFPLLLGINNREVSATARAWAAFVDGTRCVKPWAIAYEQLTNTLDPGGDPDRNLTEQDLERLRTWPRHLLRFELRFGDPTDPGNFGALDLSPGQAGGASQYEADIWDCNTRLIGRDTILFSQPGATPTSTENGLAGTGRHPGLCTSMIGNARSGGAECRDEDGQMGVTVVAALWRQVIPGAGGAFRVDVRQLVSFKVDSLKIETGKPILIGHFVAGAFTGTVSTIPSTLRRPILVQ